MKENYKENLYNIRETHNVPKATLKDHFLEEKKARLSVTLDVLQRHVVINHMNFLLHALMPHYVLFQV
jgi:hypothetical protein